MNDEDRREPYEFAVGTALHAGAPRRENRNTFISFIALHDAWRASRSASRR